MIQLFVNNEKEEYICSINLQTTSSLPNKLVVHTYSREAAILNCKRTFPIFPSNEVDKKKFLGFGKYLLERGKAAVIDLGLKRILYILPSSTQDKFESSEKLQAAIFKSGVLEVTAEAQETRQLDTVKAAVGSASGSSTGGLLSSLLAKAEETMKTREPGKYSKPSTEDRTQAVSRRVRGQIEAFLATSDCDDLAVGEGEGERASIAEHAPVGSSGPKVLVLEPMEKEIRFIVHELVETEFGEQLVSVSAGDGDDRHVEVYVRGHEPQQESFAPTDEGFQVCAVRKPRSAEGVASTAARPSAAAEQLVRVGQIKRDRRTIEEVQQSMKKRKGVGE